MKKFIFIILALFLFNTLTAQNFITSNQIGGAGNVEIQSSTLDNEDNLIISGYFDNQINFEGQDYNAENWDIFIAKFDNTHNLLWFKQIEGKGYDLNSQIVCDNNNNIYSVGSFGGSGNSIYFTENDSLVSDGFRDIFLSKFDNEGGFKWAKKIAGGPTNQSNNAISIDDYDNLYISIIYNDSVQINDGVIDTILYSGPLNSRSSAIIKYNNLGNILHLSNYQTSSEFDLYNISAIGNYIYITGRFKGEVTTPTENITSFNDSRDIIISKLDQDLTPIWLQRSYGSSNDFPGSSTNDVYGNVYLTGFFSSPDFKIDSTESLISENVNGFGGWDIFIAKLNKNGNLQWIKPYGTPSNDWSRDIFNKNNLLYLTGYYSNNFQFAEEILNHSGAQDAFIGVLDLKGIEIKGIIPTSQGVEDDSGLEITVNQNEDIILTGYFKSPQIVLGDSTFNILGTKDGFITKYKPPLIAKFSEIKEIICNGSTNGELVVTPYFGVYPYTYSWSHDAGLNDSTATSLSAGSYSVTVTDALDSTAVTQYTLTEPDSFIFNPAITDVTTCSYTAEGAIDLNVTGGNGGNNYTWSGEGTTPTSEDQTELEIGTYSVSVTDSESCTADTTINITGPPPVIFDGSAVTDDSGPEGSPNGAVDLTASGGTVTTDYSYLWSSGETVQDISSKPGGNYTVSVTDDNSCVFDTTFNIKDLDTLYIYISDKKDDCTGGSGDGKATVSYYTPNPDPVISYAWSNGGSDSTVTGLSPGKYFVTVTESDSSWTAVDSVEILDLGYTFNGSVSGSSTTTLDCYGDTDGFIDVNITSAGITPYSYIWNTGATTQDLTGLGFGTYSITATDANECQFTIPNHEITQPDEILATAEIVSNPSCNGDYDGELTVLRSGGTVPYSYLWNDPGSQTAQNADGLDAGYYTVTVSDANGCHKSSSVNLTEPPAIQVNKTPYHVSCNGGNDGAIQLAVSGGTPTFSYFWTTNDGSGLAPTAKDQSGLTAGKYYFSATDANNCLYEDSVEITEPLTLTIEETAVNDATCNGVDNGSIDITVTGGTIAVDYLYSWATTDGSGLITDAEDQPAIGAGTYDLTVTDDNGCEATTSITINEPTAISIEETTVSDISCNGLTDGSIDITVTGGTVATNYTYSWTTADGSGLAADTQDQTGLGAGTYDLTVTDDNGCEATTSVTITEPEAIAITETYTDITCNGLTNGSIDIAVTGGTVTTDYNYTWASADGTGFDANVADQTGLSAGTYNLTVTDDNGCEATTSVTITEPEAITITETYTDITCNGLTDGSIDITVTGGTAASGYTYLWASTDGNGYVEDTQNQSGLNAGTYDLTVTDDNLCEETTSIILTEPDAITIVSDTAINATSESATDGSIEVEATGGTGVLTYTLTPGDISNETGIFENLGPDSYTVEVTDENSCGPATTDLTVSFPDAIESISLSKNIKLYPNPTSSKLTLEINIDRSDMYTIEIISLSGQRLYKENTQSDRPFTKELDLSGYAKGIYFIKVSTDRNHYQERIILQ